MSPAEITPPGPPSHRFSSGGAAFAFVVVTLVALLVVPLLVQRRVGTLRREIEGSEPARTLVSRIQFDLVRQMGALTEFQLEGDPDFATAFATALAEERALHAQLAPLAAQLGPDVAERHAEAIARSNEWHARIGLADPAAASEASDSMTLALTSREEILFEEVIRAMEAVDVVILEATTRNRQAIVQAERLGLRLTVLSALLALLATGVVVVLAARARRFADESEQRRADAEAALDKAARANDARVRLLRGVTHDVKNPLGAARGYAELLATGVKGPLLPEQVPLVEGIERSVDGALAIIADLLDVAQADAGGLALHPEMVDLVGVTRAAVEQHRAAAVTAGHVLVFEPPPGPLPVNTDPARVEQVLGNLLSNAIKYTPAPGRIVVRTDEVDGDQAPREGRWALVRVTDNGPGIAAELREAIFDEFTRLENGSVKGHGLGLAIARRIARLLDGDLGLLETQEPGATFVLWLPIKDTGGRGSKVAERERNPLATPGEGGSAGSTVTPEGIVRTTTPRSPSAA